jgi:putative membrane protein insertion efficiency factor
LRRLGSALLRAAWVLVRLPRTAVVLVLRCYRMLVSPMYGDTCRFYPSCSQYALTAVERYGVLRGGWLTVRRLVRCHPWNHGGVDHVPERDEITLTDDPTTTPRLRSVA